MNRVIINLSEYEGLTALAGNRFGRDIYDKQVKDKIDIYKPFYIKFPDNIQVVSIGFVQGFISSIVEEIGIDKVKENINIESINEDFITQFISKI